MNLVSYIYEVKYTDTREGDLVTTHIDARSKEDALDEAMDDYYLGSIISCECLGESQQ